MLVTDTAHLGAICDEKRSEIRPAVVSRAVLETNVLQRVVACNIRMALLGDLMQK